MSNSKTSGGVGFVGLLQIALIVLKLCKVISVAWWIVLLPAIAYVAGVAVLLLFLVLGDRR